MSENKTPEKEVKTAADAKGAATAAKETKAPARKGGAGFPEGQCAYIGPEIRGVISRNTIFRNGIPEEVKAQAGQIPVVKKLFVPLRELPKANRSLSAGEAYKALYDRAAVEISKRWKGEK